MGQKSRHSAGRGVRGAPYFERIYKRSCEERFRNSFEGILTFAFSGRTRALRKPWGTQRVRENSGDPGESGEFGRTQENRERRSGHGALRKPWRTRSVWESPGKPGAPIRTRSAQEIRENPESSGELRKTGSAGQDSERSGDPAESIES